MILLVVEDGRRSIRLKLETMTILWSAYPACLFSAIIGPLKSVCIALEAESKRSSNLRHLRKVLNHCVVYVCYPSFGEVRAVVFFELRVHREQKRGREQREWYDIYRKA
eukprot:scaffold16049_cov73-Skeletonema_marinoi.AAC.1